MADAVGGKQREFERAREIDQGLVVGFFVAVESGAAIRRRRFSEPKRSRSCSNRARAGGCGQADEAFREFGEFFRVAAPSPFGARSFMRRDQAAKILISGAVFGQQRIEWPSAAGDLGADVRAQRRAFFAAMWKRGCAAKVVAIDHRHGGLIEAARALDQVFGNGSGFQKAERGAGVEVENMCKERSQNKITCALGMNLTADLSVSVIDLPETIPRVENSVQGTVCERHVPFVAIPGVGVHHPPVFRQGPAALRTFPRHTGVRRCFGTLVLDFHAGGDGRTKITERLRLAAVGCGSAICGCRGIR